MKTICVVLGTCFSSSAFQLALAIQLPLNVVHASPAESRSPASSETNTALFIEKRTHDLLPKIWRPRATGIAIALLQTANRYQIDPLFLMSVAKGESRFNPEARGRFGEIGLMQIKPSTARWLLEIGAVKGLPKKVNCTDDLEIARLLANPENNLAFGAAYLTHLRKLFPGHDRLSLTAYNMGALNLRSLLKNGVQPRIYADRIGATYAQLRREMRTEERMSRPRAAIQIASSTFGVAL